MEIKNTGKTVRRMGDYKIPAVGYLITGVTDEERVLNHLYKITTITPITVEDTISGVCSESAFDKIKKMILKNPEQIQQRKTAPQRILVEAGSVNIGDKINNQTVVGIGKMWKFTGEHCVYDLNLHIENVQYAYFN